MIAKIITITRPVDGKVDVAAACPRCGNPAVVRNIDYEGIQSWLGGELIQNALPDLTPADRETLISGYHDACFNLDFPEEDE